MKIKLFILICAFTLSATAQDLAATRARHLRHGINASEWFAQSNDYSIARLKAYTNDDDIALIRKMGFDHVRISIDPAVFQCSGPWSQCERVELLHHFLDVALADDLAVIIDLHPTTEYKRKLATNGDSAERFRLLWHSIAAEFHNTDPERVFFELLNEPEMEDDYRWGGIQAAALAEVRSVAPQHTVIISGATYSDIDNLLKLPALADRNIIYNFHFYEPHIFTHQGANWGVPFWVELRKVPYPALPKTLAAVIEPRTDDISRWRLTQYGLDHWDGERIAAEIGFAAAWAKRRGVSLTCNEFGVYRSFSDPEDRGRWLHDVRMALEENNIGWTMWDYRGGFGVVAGDSAGRRVPDQQILSALGLNK